MLSIETLQIAFKASHLANEHDRVFSLAKVVTDIRPVFGSEVGNPVGAVIMHTLNIDYFSNGTHEEFRVALGAEDLNVLRGVIERAEQKAKALHNMLKGTALPVYETR